MEANALELAAADGYRLAATHYPAAGVASGAPGFIVIANATGVPRGFYRRFALFAAAHDIHVLTVDYRGIGDSRRGPLRGFVMDYVDWSRLDLAAAIDWATARGPTWLVGHSLGGHAIGLLPRPNALEAAYVCGAGAGWHGWMPFPENIKVWTLWHLLAPVLTRLYGYQPMSKLGVGEDLPLGVYRDWKRWCQFPHYFFDDPKARELTAPFAQVRIPIASAAATDDLWAPPKSRDAFMRGYVNAPVDAIDLSPQGLGVPAIGHMGYFRESVGRVLWPKMMDWLRRKGLPASPDLDRSSITQETTTSTNI